MAKKPTSNSQARGARLGTQMRGALAEAYGSRGHHHSNLLYLYSPKAGADVILRCTLEYGHFLLCEGSPSIETVEYGCEQRFRTVGDKEASTIFDAIVTFMTGMTQYREVKPRAELEVASETRVGPQLALQARIASADNAEHVVLTEEEIYANPVLIRNWHRIVPWLAQARDVALNNHVREVAALVRGEGAVSLGEVLALGQGDDAALFAAAAFRGIQKGLFASDLDLMPFSVNTRMSNVEAP